MKTLETHSLRIGVDITGGDQPPSAIFEAVLQIAESANYDLVVFATSEIASSLSDQNHAHIQFFIAEESIEMYEAPLLAVRRKKKSTMAAGMHLLREKKIDAFLSTGNTGALVATALLHLDTLPGVDRPALLVSMPTSKGEVVVLDIGANIAPKPTQLVTYALLGSLFRICYHQMQKPTVGLLNIGTEEQKGTKELKETYRLLQKTFQSCFLGNVEGREVFQGKVDVLVTDGFTGNIFLKASEGISSFLIEYIDQKYDARQIVSHLHQKFNYAEHPGALLCGVDGLIVKCHGHSDLQALKNGIRGAADWARLEIIQKIKACL